MCNKFLDCPYQSKCRPHSHAYAKTKHHKYYPKCDYKTPLEKKFRWHRANIEYLCRYEHDLEHINNPKVEKPTRDFMIKFLSQH